MSAPKNKKEFSEYCLRKLGKPVISINIDPDQVDDRVDEALQYYVDYHFDATERQFYKYILMENDFPDKVKEISIVEIGQNYSNTDTLNFTIQTGDSPSVNAIAHLTTYANGSIQSIVFDDHGKDYKLPPKISINTSTGSGAVLEAQLGGYINLPDNIMGVQEIFRLDNYYSTSNIFNVRYQLALNDLYTLNYNSLVPYYMVFQHLQLLEELLTGTPQIRFNRHTNRLYLDINWATVKVGEFVIVVANQVLDPEKYRDVWNDRWLLRYATALIKKQWGSNIKKFSGMTLPGGVAFNGQQIYDEAVSEISEMEAEMLNSYSLPVTMLVG